MYGCRVSFRSVTQKINKRHVSAIIAACCVIFFVVDIHAFDDVSLRFSAAMGCNIATKATLALGANVHADNDQALTVATFYGYTEVVKTLLEHGADINAQNGAVLALAIKNGHTETVRLILDQKNFIPNCDPLSEHKRRVWLKEAERTGNKEILKLLQDRLTLPAACAPLPNKTDFDQWK
jgi:hypothetical protein